jgi:hypothetical protein
MLPIDNSAGLRITHRKTIRLLAAQRAKRYNATHYCQTHGLVVLKNDNETSKTMTTRTRTGDRDVELRKVEEDMRVAEPPLPKDDVRREEAGVTFAPSLWRQR